MGDFLCGDARRLFLAISQLFNGFEPDFAYLNYFNRFFDHLLCGDGAFFGGGRIVLSLRIQPAWSCHSCDITNVIKLTLRAPPRRATIIIRSDGRPVLTFSYNFTMDEHTLQMSKGLHCFAFIQRDALLPSRRWMI